MIPYIAELNRVLITTNSLSYEITGVERGTLIEQCKSIVIEGRMPDHSDTIEFSIQIGLLEAKGKKKVLLTEAGKTFLQFNPNKNYDLSQEQKKYLIRSFFLDGVFQKQLKECFRCFVISEKKETFTWSAIDGTPFGDKIWIISHIEQLGLIRRLKTGYIVNKEYAHTVAAFINEPKGYTEAQLLEWLEEKKKLGNIAEQIVFNFEVSRLKALGHIIESTCVKMVGKLKTNAGYDIESFDGKSKGMHFDRFIEVKGSGDPKLRFVWSQNEIKVAEKLGERYWIYYQGAINRKTGTSILKPIMIQNPFYTLEKDTRLTRTPNGIVVEGSIRGENI